MHLTFVSFLLISIVLYFFDLSFRGYDSTSIIFIGTGITGILFYLLKEKDFLRVLNFALSGICVFAVPIVIVYTYVTIAKYKQNVFYEDSSYRLERTFNGIMAPKAFPDLFIKSFLLEKKYKLNLEPIDQSYSFLRVSKLPSDSIEISMYPYPSPDKVSPIVIRIKE